MSGKADGKFLAIMFIVVVLGVSIAMAINAMTNWTTALSTTISTVPK